MGRLYLITLTSSLLISLILTPASVFLARRFGAMDPIDPRKIHRTPTPRWGGLGIGLAIFLSLFVLKILSPEFSELLGYTQKIQKSGETIFTLRLGEQLAGILFGAFLLFIVGLKDDQKPISAGMKLLFQIIAAMGAMIYGVRIYGISAPGFEAYSYFPVWLTMGATVLWLVGLTNSVNLIDGLDGLAAGVAAIVAGAFLAICLIHTKSLATPFSHQMGLAGILAAALLGAALGFLVYNFHPAHVFMGDGGSLLIGFILASLAVIGTFKTTVLAVLFVPFFLVAVPVVDMTLAVGRRIIQRRSPFSPDKNHLHHILLNRGWTQREVVFLVYVITLVLSLISVALVGVRKA